MLSYLITSLVIAVFATIAIVHTDPAERHNTWIFTVIVFIVWPLILLGAIGLGIWFELTHRNEKV